MDPFQTLFVCQLLQASFDDILEKLKLKASSLNVSPSCFVSYAWPLLSSEDGLQERVLRMCDDLQSAGIDSFMDITKANSYTDFDVSLLRWIRQSDFIVLVGSSSYATRAKDPTTLTFHECVEIGKKKQINSNSIIPVLFEGRFGTSFPPGYQDTIGGRFILLTDYMRDLPGVAASILGISNDKEVIVWLDDYSKQTQSVINNAKPSPLESKSNLIIQQQYWKSRILILHAEFSLEQLCKVDGNVKVRTRLIDEYCIRVIGEVEQRCKSYRIKQHLLSQVKHQFKSFLSTSICRVLLFFSHKPSIIPHLHDILSLRAWKANGVVPIFVDLASIDTPTSKCVEKSLGKHGLDDNTIKQAKEEREFIILVSGFERCGIHTNFYIRNDMASWEGKVAFSCSVEFQKLNPNINYYFMPSNLRTQQLPNPEGLVTVTLDPPSSLFVVESSSSSFSGCTSTQSSSSTNVQPSSSASSSSHSTTVSPTVVSNTTTSNNFLKKVEEDVLYQQRIEKGFLLLQRDNIRVKCREFIASIRALAPNPYTNDIPVQAFISYAWPPDPKQLQQRLLDLVEDLSVANITVLLDIMQLRPGSDVKRFMEEKIESSHTILWIGTPELKSRITFDADGKPKTNAAIEFCHIRDKDAKHLSSMWSIQSLWFTGKSTFDVFPVNHGLKEIQHDFSRERDYFIRLPQLVASIFGIINTPPFTQAYDEYLENVKLWENSFSLPSIELRLQMEENQAAQRYQETEVRIKSLLDNMPSTYVQQQREADDAQKQALFSRVSDLKRDSLFLDTHHTQALEYYVPLNGGTKMDSHPSQHFKAFSRISSFLKSNKLNTSVIFGTAGGGKSLFAKFLEHSLWNRWEGKHTQEWIPIFISLPRFASSILSSPLSPNAGLVEKVLQSLHFTSIDIESLRNEFHFLFIIDGLDEVSFESLPNDNFLLHTGLSKWLTQDNKAIVFCRTQHVSILESRLGTPIYQYFNDTTISTSHHVDTFHIMPFNGSQISQFLTAYSKSSESQLYTDWSRHDYEDHINNINGLASIVQTPFVLKLVVKIIPRLIDTKRSIVTSFHVYLEFTKQLFEREMWKRVSQGEVSIERNLLTEFQSLSKRLSQSLFVHETTTASFESLAISEEDKLILNSIPIHISEGRITFIHKSIQEFFVSQLWMNSIDSKDAISISSLMNTRLISNERGVLGFISQQIHLPTHSEMLLDRVSASRTDKDASIASSNALTILNTCRFSFSMLDLSYIHAPGADLRNSIMDSTNLSHANLEGASMQQSWLKSANLQNANLKNIQLGEYPFIKLNGICRCMYVSGNRIIVGVGNTIVVWDMEIMEQIGDPLKGHTDRVICVTECNGQIVSGSSDYTIRVWDMETMKQIGDPYESNNNIVYCIAIYDGKIVFGTWDGFILVWDMETRKQIGEPVKAHKNQVMSVVVYDGIIISIGVDKIIKKWDMKSMKEMNIFGFYGVSVRCFAVYDEKLVSGSEDGEIRVSDMRTMRQIGEPLESPGSVTSVVVYDDKIISGSSNGAIRIWDMKTMGQIGETLQGHTGEVWCLVVCSGKIISANSGKIRIWDMAPMKHIGDPLQYHNSCVCSIAMYDRKIVFGSDDNTIRVWDLETMKYIGNPLQHTGSVNCVAVYDGKIVSGSDDMTIRVWDLATMKKIGKPLKGHTESVTSLVVYDGKIVSGSHDKTIRVWDMETMKQIGDPLEGHTSSVLCIAVSNGKIVSGSFDNTIRVWDIATMKQIGDPLQHTTFVSTLVVYDGKIASVSFDKIKVWDMERMIQICAPLRCSQSGVTSMVVYCGKIIIGSQYDTLEVWDMETMKRIEIWKDRTDGVYSAAVHDGKLVTGNKRGVITVWDVTTMKSHNDDLSLPILYKKVRLCGGSIMQKISGLLSTENTHVIETTAIQQIEKSLHPRYYLIHCNSTLPLCFEGCNIKGVKFLSKMQVLVLQQRGSVN